MKVALYARVSSEKQDVDLSISAQLKALREYAAKNDHQIVKEFIDEAESGKTTDRPAFREMISAARRSQQPFELILVWKYSRFARSREDSIVFKTMLRKRGIRVISINEPAEDTPTGKLLEAMIESLDEFYIANLGEEVTRGMRESASRGFYISARPPYGYRKVKVKDGEKERTRLDIEPNQASIVLRIFAEAQRGKGQIEIVKLLNKEGISGPGNGGWKKTTIGKILTQEIYTGTLVWGRNSIRGLPPIRVENAYPEIVDKQTFDQVQKLVKERAPLNLHPKRVASRYLLSGLARCGYCGKALVGQDAKSGKFTYYVCGTLLKKGAEACPTHYLNSQKFENLVTSKIKDHVLTTENLTQLVNMINHEMDSLEGEYQENLERIINEMKDTDHRLERLYDALETGLIKLSDLAPRIQQLKSLKDELQAKRWDLELQISQRRVELADPDVVASYVAELRDLLNEGSLAERKAFIRSFIKEVKVTGDEVLLSYTIPMQPKGITEEKLSVLSIGHDGGW
jgi:site-specific DNA recombinase